MNKNRREFLRHLSAAGVLAQPVCAWAVPSATAATDASVTIKGSALGTDWYFTAKKNLHIQDALSIIRQTLNLIDQTMSPYLSDSDVTLFNQQRVTEQQFSSISAPVVTASLEIANASGGAFDPTVGPLVNRAGFGPIKGSVTSRYTDLSWLNNVLGKNIHGATIDLCGIAKGYALDLIAATLVEQGFTDFLIEIGGEIRVNGKHPTGRELQIGLDMPSGSSMLKAKFPAGCHSVATSGVAQQSYYYNRQLNSHLVNPLISEPQTNDLYSVSVLHTSAMLADAWSTALFVMGRENAIECANQNGLHALMVVIDKNNHSQTQYDITTTGKARRIKEKT